MTNSKGMRLPTRLMPLGALTFGLYLHAMSTALAGEVIYKSIDTNGEISYSQRPDPGARRVETIDVNTFTPEQRRAMRRYQLEELMVEQKVNADAVKMEAKLTQIDNEIRQANTELQKAEAALQAGRTPLPGERRGNKGGGSRLTQAYFDRLLDLEVRGERAKQRLDNAYDARNALR